jgi:hypothetical protein
MRTIPIVLFVASFSSALATQPPSPEAMRRYEQELDRLERMFASSPDPLGVPLWRESKRVADRNGPDIVAAVLQRAGKWQGEEGLFYVPLVALLPRQPTLKLLRAYQRSPHELERIWAGEFITEFDMSDTKKAVRRFSK